MILAPRWFGFCRFFPTLAAPRFYAWWKTTPVIIVGLVFVVHSPPRLLPCCAKGFMQNIANLVGY